jgi:hypothetical protein
MDNLSQYAFCDSFELRVFAGSNLPLAKRRRAGYQSAR